MKRIMMLCLTGLMIVGIPAVSLAADATFSGEIDTGWQGWQQSPSGINQEYDSGNDVSGSSSTDYAFGKMVLNGKLGDDLSGVLVFKDADTKYSRTAANMSRIVVDEASLSFSEDWGVLQLGYFGWNIELQDILPVWTDDIKSQTTAAYSVQLTDSLHLGLALAYTGTGSGTVHDPWINDGTVMVSGKTESPDPDAGFPKMFVDTLYFPSLPVINQPLARDLNTAVAYKNAFGANLGFSGDICGGDLLYYHYNDNDSAWGVNAFLRLGDFKPFFEYRSFQSNASKTIPTQEATVIVTQPYTLVNCIVGLTYEPAASPFYARAEVDLYGSGFFAWSLDFFNELYNAMDTIYYYNAKYNYAGCPWGVRLGYKLNGGAKIEAQYYHTGYDLDEAFSFAWDGVAKHTPDDYTVSAPQNKYYLKLICTF